MIDLDVISKELERYKEVKGKELLSEEYPKCGECGLPTLSQTYCLKCKRLICASCRYEHQD